MRGNFQSLLRKFCLEGSILGLKYFYLYPDRLTRCFWTVVMSLNLCLACLLTWLLYDRFQQMPTRITIENQYEYIWNLPFPAVTLCTPTQMTISSMKHFNRTLINGRDTYQSMDLEQTLTQLLGFYEIIGNLDVNALANLQILMDLNRYSAIEVIMSMSQGCDKFLKLCYFHRKLYPCGELFNPILTRHGMCCIFNSMYNFNKRNKKNKEFYPRQTLATGITEALTVVVDYEPMNAIDKTVLTAGSTRVMVTDWTEFPADDESRLVPPNTESLHMIHATYTYCSEDVTTLTTQSRKCYFEEERSLPYFGGYRNSDCDLLCFASEVERRCHCSMLYLPHLKSEAACKVISIPCIIEAKMQMSKWYRTDLCDCPRDCESRRYRLELSVGNLHALPHMIKPYPNVTFTESTSILHLYFPTSVYVKQKQETVMSLIILASNLGGVFGLCLGCSYITIYEILFYIYVAIKNHLRGRLRRALYDTVYYNN